MHYIINQPKPCLRLIPLFSIVTLLLLLITTLFPLQISSAHADSTNPSRSITWHEPTVELNIQNSHLNTSLAPKQNGTFSNIATNIEINVTQSSGYQIYLQSENNFLVGQSPDNSTNIPSITETQLPSEFAPNTWGYSFAKGTHTFSDYTTFEPIPTSETVVASSSTSESTTYTLIFGAKIDQTIPADTYSGKVLLSLVAKPLKVTLGLDAMAEQDLPMQSMTKQFCQEAQTGETVRLKDLRGDGKGNEQYYWITKLADGNCWMTQNLALDLSTTGLSTSSGSNVNWNASSTYPPENTVTAISDWVNKPTKPQSANLGQYVANDLTTFDQCRLATTSLDTCPFLTNVSTLSPYTGPGDFYSMTSYEQDGVTYTKPAKTTVDEANGYYDAHYLIGNYYSYNAATAGTGATLTEKYQIAPGNICPKGWDLPLSGAKYNNTSGSFYNLLNQYHLFQDYGTPGTEGYKPASAAAEDDGMASPLALIPGTKTTVQTALTRAPLYYTYSGSITYSGVWHPNTYSLLASKVFLYTENNFSFIAAFDNYLSPSENSKSRDGTAIRCYFSAN